MAGASGTLHSRPARSALSLWPAGLKWSGCTRYELTGLPLRSSPDVNIRTAREKRHPSQPRRSVSRAASRPHTRPVAYACVKSPSGEHRNDRRSPVPAIVLPHKLGLASTGENGYVSL